MTPLVAPLAGIAVLAFAWGGPLPHLVPASFAAHMTLHMSVVAIGVPLVAIGIAARFARLPIWRVAPAVAIVVSLLDLVVVWGWHAPALHHAARSDPLVLAVEQASFAGVSLLLWFFAFAGPPLLGALSLFFTSMHMTLLGALLGLAPRPGLAAHHNADQLSWLTALQDQQLGGTIMLAVGGAVYLGAGLYLASRVLRRRTS